MRGWKDPCVYFLTVLVFDASDADIVWSQGFLFIIKKLHMILC